MDVFFFDYVLGESVVGLGIILSALLNFHTVFIDKRFDFLDSEPKIS